MITLDDRMVWSNDSYLEIILFYLIESISSNLIKETNFNSLDKIWFKEYLEKLNYFLKGFFAGAIDFQLDELSACKKREDFFITNIVEVKEILENKGELLSIEILNEIENKKPDEKIYWKKPIETKKVIEIIDDIVDMLQEKRRSHQ